MRRLESGDGRSFRACDGALTMGSLLCRRLVRLTLGAFVRGEGFAEGLVEDGCVVVGA